MLYMGYGETNEEYAKRLKEFLGIKDIEAKIEKLAFMNMDGDLQEAYMQSPETLSDEYKAYIALLRKQAREELTGQSNRPPLIAQLKLLTNKGFARDNGDGTVIAQKGLPKIVALWDRENIERLPIIEVTRFIRKRDGDFYSLHSVKQAYSQ